MGNKRLTTEEVYSCFLQLVEPSLRSRYQMTYVDISDLVFFGRAGGIDPECAFVTAEDDAQKTQMRFHMEKLVKRGLVVKERDKLDGAVNVYRKPESPAEIAKMRIHNAK